jgi:hypothetical protein
MCGWISKCVWGLVSSPLIVDLRRPPSLLVAITFMALGDNYAASTFDGSPGGVVLARLIPQ